MKKLLLIIPLVLFLVSCSERESERESVRESVREIDEAKLQVRDGIFYAVNEDKPYSGKVTSFYQNGQLKAESTSVHGKIDGLYRSWYENGQLKTESTLVNGGFEGLYRRWHENGQLKTESTYVNGTCVSGCE